MSTDFFSQATNFQSAAAGRVDPRTGLFNYMMPVAHLIGNNLLGPELTLALTYSPLNSADIGFGLGFSLGLSQYDAKNRILILSTGERYKVDESDKAVLLRQYKQDVVRFEKDVIQDVYRVIHKSGLVEILTGPLNAFDIKVPKKLVNSFGHYLTFDWLYEVNEAPHLASISDETSKLLNINYKKDICTEITVWPGSSEAYNIELIFYNNKISQIKNRTPNQILSWELDYDPENEFLCQVSTPTGLTEWVMYNPNGHQFPQGAYLPRLPYVTQYMQYTKDRVGIVRDYEYTDLNFLGYGAEEGSHDDWASDDDYLYNVLSDYLYGSKEIWHEGQTQRIITRRYNNYHLLVSETIAQNGCIREHQTEYYAKRWVGFNKQPPQFQTPKSATVRFISDSGQREEVTRTEFDAAGNPTLQITPDGTRTEWVYYPAEGELTRPNNDCYGCPADPHGFVRYVKSKTVTPGAPSSAGACDAYNDAPVYQVIYRYASLPTLPEALTKETVVCTHQRLYCVDRQSLFCQLLHQCRTDYISQPDSPHYGRVGHVEQTVYDLQTPGKVWPQQQVFHYELDSGHLKQTEQWFSYKDQNNDLLDAHIQTRSCLSNKVLYEEDSQGCTNRYHYDGIGRLEKQEDNSGTTFARKVKYAYALGETGEVTTTKTDVRGNQSRIWFDGTGQAYRQAICLKGQFIIINLEGQLISVEELKVAETERDSWGRVVSQTGYDWLPTEDDPMKITPITVNQKIAYDNWGQACVVMDATGKRSRQDYDPVTRISRQTMEAKGLKFGTTETEYDVRHQPLTVTLLDSDKKVVSQQSYAYDGLGRLRADIDVQGKKTEYTYDAFNRVSTIHYDDGTDDTDDTVIKKTYAPFSAGNLVVKIEVNGKILGEREFDRLERIVSSKVGGRVQTANYQGTNQAPVTSTDPLGQTVKIQYEPRLGNAPIQIETPDLTQKLTYDAQSGQITEVQAVGKATQQYTYTPRGWLQQETMQFDDPDAGSAHSAVYHYSPTGQLTAYRDMAGVSHRLRFDRQGRPVEAMDDAVSVILRYDAAGRTDRWTVKDKATKQQLTTTVTFDDFSREIRRRIEDGTDILTLDQTYTPAGQLASRTTGSQQAGQLRKEYYIYDDARRWLTDYRCSGVECPRDAYGQILSRQQFTYDRLGNLLTCITTLADGSQDTACFSYTNLDDPCQLTKITHSHPAYPATIVLIYDKAGRLIEDESNRMLAYDGLGRLASVTQAGSTQTYSYDASGRLVLQQRSKDDTRELYYQSVSRVAEIQRESGAVTRLVQTGSVPAAMVTDSGVHLLGTDKAGSVLLSRQNGREARFHYTPYGQQAAADSDPNLPGYNGERQDPTGGGYHLGNGYRTYNPVLMRFTAPDSLSPFGAGGLNPYAYCLGDPINRSDPSGHMSVGSILGIVFASLGLILGVVAAIPSGGASLSMCGAIFAGLDFLSNAAMIGSSATEESNPQLSSILNYVSLVGLVSPAISMVKCSREGILWLLKKVGIIEGRTGLYRLEGGFVSDLVHGMGVRRFSATAGAMIYSVGAAGVNKNSLIHKLFNKWLNWINTQFDSGEKNTQSTFDRATNAHQNSVLSTLEPGISPEGTQNKSQNIDSPFLKESSFNTASNVSRMNNSIINPKGYMDILILMARKCYTPFINSSCDQVSDNAISYINHSVGTSIYSASQNRGLEYMVSFDRAFIRHTKNSWNIED
ncbi:RHS repeat domain-containing protein [Xenorhabdus stockiae]|uniref:RHS repeat domain-containing protein n=1 Tax=Xenorhabdus stockiae TaxID=351614 RepID=UPI00406428D7